jgi:hypothetical protein
MEIVSEVLPLAPERIRKELASMMLSRGATALTGDRFQHDDIVVSLICSANASGRTLAEFRIHPADDATLRATAQVRVDSELNAKAAASKRENRSYYLNSAVLGIGGGLGAMFAGMVVAFAAGGGWGVLTWLGLTVLVMLSSLPSWRRAQTLEDEVKAMKLNREQLIAAAVEARRSELRTRAASIRPEIESLVKRVQFSAG